MIYVGSSLSGARDSADPRRPAHCTDMQDNDQLWLRSGLHRFQIVRCVVTGHRGRFALIHMP